jgi:hypothetical protein
VSARVLAQRGELADAEAFAREATALAAATDFSNCRADALLDLSQVLRLGHRRDEAAAAARQAVELYVRKGNTIAAAVARRHLGDMAQT